MDDITLKKLRNVQIELLNEFCRICKKKQNKILAR